CASPPRTRARSPSAARARAAGRRPRRSSATSSTSCGGERPRTVPGRRRWIDPARLLRWGMGGEGQADADRRTRLLLRAGQVFASSLDYDLTLQNLADLVVPELADWCGVHMLAEGGLVLPLAIRHRRADGDEISKEWITRFPARVGDPAGIGRVVREGRTASALDVTPAILRAFAPSEEAARVAERVGVRSVIIVPLRVRGETVGAVSLAMAESGRRHAPEDVTLAEDLALRAAAAIDNARLLQAERDQRARAERALSALGRLHAVTSALAGASTLEEVGSFLVREASASVEAESGLLALLDEEGRALDLFRIHEVPDDLARPFARIPLDADLPAAEAFRTGEPVFVETREALYARWSGLQGRAVQNEAWAVVPLVWGETRLGAAWFGFPAPRAFSAEDRAFLLALAAQGAQALGRTRLEAASRLQRRLLESENEAALDGICLQGADGRVIFHNRRLLALFHVEEKALREAGPDALVAACMGQMEDPEAFRALARKLGGESDDSLRFDLRLRGGRTLDAYTAPVKGERGERVARAWYFRDVTERRRLEAELLEARRQLAHREKLAAMGTLVSGVAHEIRTPLAYMGNHAFVLQRLAAPGSGVPEGEAARLREAADAIVEGVDRINHLVRELRRFVRMNEGEPRAFAWDEMVEAAARLFEVTHRG